MAKRIRDTTLADLAVRFEAGDPACESDTGPGLGIFLGRPSAAPVPDSRSHSPRVRD